MDKNKKDKLINADTFDETFSRLYVDDGWKLIRSNYNRMKGVLSEMPTIDAVPVVHGNWTTKEYMYGDPDVGIEDMWVDRLAESTDYYAECSICGKNAGYDGEGNLILSDFCPHCGAKMEE